MIMLSVSNSKEMRSILNRIINYSEDFDSNISTWSDVDVERKINATCKQIKINIIDVSYDVVLHILVQCK